MNAGYQRCYGYTFSMTSVGLVLGGGGVASLRNDPQGKGYSQILLQTPIAVPADLAKELA